ncbi:MAG TPA: glycosyltransferase family 4 protein [Vicinamibacterales bacterium]|nr:glycosyltransferase family 4 protein [Vicinamibacterales bacterium]
MLRHGLGQKTIRGSETTVTVDCLKEMLDWRSFVPHLFRYGEARILSHRVESIGRPLKLGLMLRVLSRGDCYVEDDSGARRPLTARLLARWAWDAAREPFQKSALLGEISDEVAWVEAASRDKHPRLELSASPVYFRTDLAFGVHAGGSLAHIAGVVNHLHEFTGPPIVLTTDPMSTIRSDVEVECVPPAEAFWGYVELPSLVLNRAFDRAAARLDRRALAFVYQRYSVNNFAGARLALQRRLPFVLEYNGSEIWIARHWGTPLRHEQLSHRIELANLTAADLVVVVSRAMADELIARGVAADKVLVNPNGVEPDQYAPSVDGAPIRRALGLEGKMVVGFIGTFGAWHGAELLADAFGRLLKRRPDYRDCARLLLIGDGVRMPLVREALARNDAARFAVLTGLVRQEQGPQYLAACDLLVSPHVPNPDGTPFFGSPTKLFEYMAMGKGIVASDLDQIGEILEHGRAARLVVPGDVESLVSGLEDLIDHPERRETLGREARRLAVERHTWREHTARIITRLGELLPPA